VGVAGGSEAEVDVVGSSTVDVSSTEEEDVSLTIGGRSVVKSSISPVLEELGSELSETLVELADSSVPFVLVGSGRRSVMMGSRSMSLVLLELESELEPELDRVDDEEALGEPDGVPLRLDSVSVSVVLVVLGSGIMMPVGPMMMPPPLVDSSSSSSSDLVEREPEDDEVESPPMTPSRRSSSSPLRVEDWMVVVEAGSGSSSVVELPI
jgi:hypothetical protein